GFHGAIDDLVTGPEIVFEQLENAKTRVRRARGPIDHGNTWELRRIADELGFAGHVDAKLRQMREHICEHRAGEIPVRVRNWLSNMAGRCLSTIIGGNGADLVHS